MCEWLHVVVCWNESVRVDKCDYTFGYRNEHGIKHLGEPMQHF